MAGNAGRPAARSLGEPGSRYLLGVVAGRRRAIAGAAALTLATSGLGLAQPLMVKEIIGSAGPGRMPWAGAGALLALLVAQTMLDGCVRYLLARTGESVILEIRLGLIDRLLRLRMRAYDRHRIGDLISRAGTDTAALRQMVATGLTDAATGFVGIAAAVTLMIWLDPTLFLLVLLLVGAAGLILTLALRGIRAASLAGQAATGEMAADLERALGAIRTVRACRADRREATRVAEHARAAYSAQLRTAKFDAVVSPAGELAITGSFLLVLLVGGTRVASGNTSLADLVAFLLYLVYLMGPLGSVIEAISVIQQATGAAHRIEQVFTWPEEDDDRPRWAGEPPQEHEDGADTAVELRDVWFGYTTERTVLRGVSFRVPRRGLVALIGPSGAGKSTIFALLERFYDPDKGRILVHGTDLRAMDRNTHRSHVGLVEQDCPILHGTLRDNLTYAAPTASAAELHRAIRLANLSELVSRLPRGLDNPVGERGAALSGGERQRIAIARALLCRPRLLLLDEPTSHLDAESEIALRRTIDQVATECALIVIAHRFTTIRAAAHVIVLDQGVVAAAGTHRELVDRSDYYRELSAEWAGPAESESWAWHGGPVRQSP